MKIKSILVPVEAADYRDSLLEAALLLARRTGSYIEGCALGVQYIDPVVASAMGGAAIPTSEVLPSVSVEELRGSFTDFMLRNGVPRVQAPEGELCFGWTRDELLTDYQFGDHARVFDAVVAGRPDPDGSSPRLETVECSLFEGARPVLVVPPDGFGRLDRTVVVAWNCSTEAARAVSFCMELLESASRVVVLTVEGGTVAGPSGGQLCAMLRAHRIDAEELTVAARDMKTGEAILQHSKELGADLIVKGAYTHSRLRQRIFGGATSHLLYRADLPMLMAS